jgi:hypothetical protein
MTAAWFFDHAWWILPMIVPFIIGHYMGFQLGFNRGRMRGRAEGRMAMAFEIERASGMHDPVCTCAYAPEHCSYHTGTWQRDNKTETN